MKTTCYMQLVPRYNRSGQLVGVFAKHLSQRSPEVPAEGARLIRLEINTPDEAFKATRVNVDIPLEKLATNVNAKVV